MKCEWEKKEDGCFYKIWMLWRLSIKWSDNKITTGLGYGPGNWGQFEKIKWKIVEKVYFQIDIFVFVLHWKESKT
jgi:hypothetical protein